MVKRLLLKLHQTAPRQISRREGDGKFYERSIMMLPGRWQKVIEQNGQYIID